MPNRKSVRTGLHAIEKKVDNCKHCGGPTIPSTVDTSGRIRHYHQCSTCQDFKKRFGFTLTFQDRAFLDSKPYCNICGTTHNLHIDHCHKTNKIRGYLCRNHNTALGKFNDDVEELRSAIEYLLTSTKPNETTQAAS